MFEEENFIFKAQKDFGILCKCAIRGCLGGYSYFQEEVCRIILENLDSISDTDLDVISRIVDDFLVIPNYADDGSPLKQNHDVLTSFSEELHCILEDRAKENSLFKS